MIASRHELKVRFNPDRNSIRAHGNLPYLKFESNIYTVQVQTQDHNIFTGRGKYFKTLDDNFVIICKMVTKMMSKHRYKRAYKKSRNSSDYNLFKQGEQTG